MFAGGKPPRSTNRPTNNVRCKQLFHELKQQFPNVPDHLITTSISTFVRSRSPNREATLKKELNAKELMGRSPKPNTSAEDLKVNPERPNPSEMSSKFTDNSEVNVKYSKNNDSISVQENDNFITPRVVDNSTFFVRRPEFLDLKNAEPCNFGKLQPSGKCTDFRKLLNSEKPPKSPLTSKRLMNKCSPTKTSPLSDKPTKELVSTPTQTTDTLNGSPALNFLNVQPPSLNLQSPSLNLQSPSLNLQSPSLNLQSPSLNLNLNVNCSLTPSPPVGKKRTSVCTLTPTQPWLPQAADLSPRSYTSVNLTLRPPSNESQPIDITSNNSQLTYSTTSFDPSKGLQSRLQITVGPGNENCVSSVRARPRSSYHPEEGAQEVAPLRTAGSLNDISTTQNPPVILQQQVRIERLRIELCKEKTKLVIMQRHVEDLELEKEKKRKKRQMQLEMEKQLMKEIKNLTYMCAQKEGRFYNNIYTGPRLPSNFPLQLGAPPLLYPTPAHTHQDETEGPKWNCHLCTYLNHPDLDQCEQCDMPRVLHGTKNNNSVSCASRSLSLVQSNADQIFEKLFSKNNQEGLFNVQQSNSVPSNINILPKTKSK